MFTIGLLRELRKANPAALPRLRNQYHAAYSREAQDVVVRIGDEEAVDPVVFLGRQRFVFSAPAAFLRAGIPELAAHFM
jgi:hypothetical protein